MFQSLTKYQKSQIIIIVIPKLKFSQFRQIFVEQKDRNN